jgi:hypothetical protein
MLADCIKRGDYLTAGSYFRMNRFGASARMDEQIVRTWREERSALWLLATALTELFCPSGFTDLNAREGASSGLGKAWTVERVDRLPMYQRTTRGAWSLGSSCFATRLGATFSWPLRRHPEGPCRRKFLTGIVLVRI